MTFSEKLKNIRREKGFSQKEIAEKLGVSQPSYAQYENGKRKPKIETLRRIASALGVGLEDFMSEAELSLFESMAQLYLKSDDDIEELESLDEHSPQEDARIIKRKIELKTRLLIQYEKSRDSAMEDIEYLTAEVKDLQGRIDKLSAEIQELQKSML